MDRDRFAAPPPPTPLIQEVPSDHPAAVTSLPEFDEGEAEEEQEHGSGLLPLVLNVLTIILSSGRSDRSPEEEAVIRRMVPPLQKIALQEIDSPPLQEAAHDLAGVLLHRQLAASSLRPAPARHTDEEDAEAQFQKSLRALQETVEDSAAKAFQLHMAVMALRDMASRGKVLLFLPATRLPSSCSSPAEAGRRRGGGRRAVLGAARRRHGLIRVLELPPRAEAAGALLLLPQLRHGQTQRSLDGFPARADRLLQRGRQERAPPRDAGRAAAAGPAHGPRC